MMADVGLFLLLVVGAGVLLASFLTLIISRKSQDYRKTLMDMYVAAKIKFLAKTDGLDIAEEFESFKKWTKKQNISNGDLDNVIENEIKEQISEPIKKEKKETKK